MAKLSVPYVLVGAGALVGVFAFACDSTDQTVSSSNNYDGGFLDGHVDPTAACQPESATETPGAPPNLVFVRNFPTGEPGWFSSPVLVDLIGDGHQELIAGFSSLFVFDGTGAVLAKGTSSKGRIFAPAVVTDLENDNVTDIVVGGTEGTVAAYEYRAGGASDSGVPSGFTIKTGWPVSTCSAGQCPEVHSVAAADLDGDGKLEVVAATTQGSPSGAQVFVFSPNGASFQPKGAAVNPAWPRFNTSPGAGNDTQFYVSGTGAPGQGNKGAPCLAENIAIGNLDDDPVPELVVTFDNHQINAFKNDGTSILVSNFYTNPLGQYSGQRIGWGQFARWFSPKVEDDYYHAHRDPPPTPDTYMWLQWSASPPNIADIDGDGHNDIIGIPNAQLNEFSVANVTQGYAVMVLQGAYDGGANSAKRVSAFSTLPISDKPPSSLDAASSTDPMPQGVPAATTVNILNDARPEIIAPMNDGYIYAIGPDGQRLWRYDFTKGEPNTFASEVTVADLNKDGRPELIFGTYSHDPKNARLVVLSNLGAVLAEISLSDRAQANDSGIGIAAAPSIGDVNGDGVLDIVVTTMDHGMDLFTVPGSGKRCMMWTTARGSSVRTGTGPSTRSNSLVPVDASAD